MRFLLSSTILLLGSGVLVSCSGSIKSKSKDNRSAVPDAADPGQDVDGGVSKPDLPDGSIAAKLRMESGCIDPDLTKVLNTESITLCDGKQAKGLLAISSLDIRNGTKVGGVVGSLVVPENCANEGDQSCVVTGTMTAVSTVGLADKLVETATVAGVKGNVYLPSAADIPIGVSYGVGGNTAGTRRHTRACRNGVDFSTRYSSEPKDTLEGTFTLHLELWGGIIDEVGNFIPVDTTNLATGDRVQLRNDGSTMPGPLAIGQDYFVIVDAGGGKIQLTETYEGGVPGPVIDITSKGNGNLYLVVYKATGNTAHDWDTVDDYNAGKPTGPKELVSGWNATTICDESNFTKVPAEAGLTADGDRVIEVDGAEAFTDIWRDDLTGLYFTNILYSNSDHSDDKTLTWAGAVDLCAAVTSGDGVGKWRLPTQKELMQLYVNGVSKVPLTGKNWRGQNMWASTSYSEGANKVWVGNLAQGIFHSDFRTNNKGVGAFCVR